MGGERRKTCREDGASRTLRGSGGIRRGWQWRQELLSGWNIKTARSKACDVGGQVFSGRMEEEGRAVQRRSKRKGKVIKRSEK